MAAVDSSPQPDDTTEQPEPQDTHKLSVQDTIEMPLQSISRIIKTALPNNIMISKEVKQSLCKSAGIFILYITSYANDSCIAAKRTTVTANDVLYAVKEAELQQFIPALNYYLTEYRRDMTSKKNKQFATGRARTTNNLVKSPANKRQRTESVGSATKQQQQATPQTQQTTESTNTEQLNDTTMNNTDTDAT